MLFDSDSQARVDDDVLGEDSSKWRRAQLVRASGSGSSREEGALATVVRADD
jgi:hypothetical protein